MDGYMYFRCKYVEISFRIQSTSMHQGVLNISHVFNEDWDEVDSFRASPDRRRNNRPILLSAMPGTTQILRLPWNNPTQWARIPDIAAVPNDHFNIGVVDLDVISRLRSVAPVAENVKVLVFASFIDPEVAGPSIYHAEGKGKGKPSGKSSVGSVAETVSKAASGVVDFATTIVDTVETGVELASSLIPLAMLVLDKPTDGQAAAPTYDAYGSGQLNIEGVANEVTLGASQLSMLSQQQGVMGPGVPNPSLKACLATPGYLLAHDFSDSLLRKHWFVTPYAFAPVDGTHFAPTFLNYFSLPFQFWRGSITYQVFFFCSNFTSARFRLTWSPFHTAAVPILNQTGNIMSKVVEVRGDTHTTVTVPYAKPELWSTIQKAGDLIDHRTQDNGVFQIDRMSISSVAVDPIVSMLVYAHAGPDYQVGRYVTEIFQTSNVSSQTKRRFVSEGEGDEKLCAAVWEYAEVSDPITTSVGIEVSGFAQSESYEDLCSLFKRFHQTTFYGSGTPATLPPSLDNHLGGSNSPVLALLNCFRYFRGGIRAQFIRDATGANSTMTIQSSKGVFVHGNPGTFGAVFRVKMPWFGPIPFRKTELNITLGQPVTVLTTGTCVLLWAFSDDIGVSGLFSPPLLHVTINA
jgi:hypothetical protein